MENRQTIVPEWIVDTLQEWFAQHKRTLPWRSAPTPYHVWVSEIMLQQTRVEAVKGYYDRFLSALPTISSLADAKEEELLKLWEGLGYYNRVRNMQAAAKMVMEEYDGEFPERYEEILRLKGIGEYTAGAIASIAFGEAVPAVDGNVLRVISRLLGSYEDISLPATKKHIMEWLKDIVPLSNPGMFNQALMDLGATICIPNGEPKCGECPWRERCVAFGQELTGQIPVKAKKGERRKEQKTVLILLAQNRVGLTKRPDKGLLAGMWQFPVLDTFLSLKKIESIMNKCNLWDYEVKSTSTAKHIFSHVEWQMKGRVVKFSAIPEQLVIENQPIVWVTLEEMQTQYSIPSAFAVYRQLVMKNWKT